MALLIVCAIVALFTGDTTTTDRLSGLERCPELAKGDIGVCVARAQRLVNEACAAGLDVDGVFGPGTSAAVQSCQRRLGLTPDGIVGPRTAFALSSRRTGPLEG